MTKRWPPIEDLVSLRLRAGSEWYGYHEGLCENLEDDGWLRDFDTEALGREERVDSNILVVTKNSFWFQAIGHYSDLSVESRLFSADELDAIEGPIEKLRQLAHE